jgi:WS/DGAT/MGAT family acyltransferase
MAIMSSLFDLDAEAADPNSSPDRWVPLPPPADRKLLADNLSATVRTLWMAMATVTRPRQTVDRGRLLIRTARGYAGRSAAPGSSLNQPVRAGRRIQFLTLDVTAMKDVAHSCGGTLNDVVLDLWAGGLRQLLAARDEPTAGVELITAVAVSLRSATELGTVDNRTGALVMPLPVGEPDPRRRLERIVATTRAIKATQPPAPIAGFLAALAGTPLGRYYVNHQRANNVLVTNVTGPPVPVYLLGARVREILPIIQILGNVGLTLCAFSYAGQAFLVVTADAAGFPDLDVLTRGMQQDWAGLQTGEVTDQTETGTSTDAPD